MDNLINGSALEVYKDGQVAEDILKLWFEESGKKVQDVRYDKVWQKYDVDFIVAGKNIEVKYDALLKKTGNIALELNNNTKNLRGWFHMSKADMLFIMPKGREDITYVFQMNQLKDCLTKHPEAFDIRKKYDNASRCSFTIGLLNINRYESLGYAVTEISIPNWMVREVDGNIEREKTFRNWELTCGYTREECIEKGLI